MQRKRGHGRILFSAWVAVALAGCRPAPPTLAPPPAPHRGTALRVACPEAAAGLVRGPARAWTLRQGVKVEFASYDPSRPGGPESAGPADVWVLAPAELPRWAAAGQLAPLPESFTSRESGFGWPDLLPTYREQLVLWQGEPHGVPLSGESPVCFYRRDLLDDPARRAAYRKRFGHDPAPPATWEEFARLAEFFREAGPGLPPLPSAGADLDRLFYTVASGYARRAVAPDKARDAGRQDDLFSFHYDLKTGRPRLDSPGFVQALRLLQRLQKCRPAAPADRPEEAFRDGRAVLCLADAPWLKTFQTAPSLRDRVGVCPVPGGERVYDYATGDAEETPKGNRVPYLGGAGWLAVVPRSAARPQAAFDLLAELGGPKTTMQTFLGAERQGGPVRTGQLYRSRWDAFDVDEKEEQHVRDALQESLLRHRLVNPALCLRTPRQAAHRAELVRGVRAALRDGADAGQTLRDVTRAWRKLDEEQGAEAHLADYRRSLGLRAKP